MDVATDGVDPDAPILLLCRSGARSNAAAELLISAGYSQAMNIAGGFESPQSPGNGWKDSQPSTDYLSATASPGEPGEAASAEDA